MASIMHVVNAAVGAVKKTYQNVWSGSADRTKQGKKSAMRHFDKYCESVQLPAFENWTKEQARGYLTVAMMQEFGGYLCVATNFDNDDFLKRDTALQYFSGVKMVLSTKYAKEFKNSTDVREKAIFDAFFDDKEMEDWNSSCRNGISQIISTRNILGGEAIVSKAPHVGKYYYLLLLLVKRTPPMCLRVLIRRCCAALLVVAAILCTVLLCCCMPHVFTSLPHL
jgi:hypothetical protein